MEGQSSFAIWVVCDAKADVEIPLSGHYFILGGKLFCYFLNNIIQFIIELYNSKTNAQLSFSVLHRKYSYVISFMTL